MIFNHVNMIKRKYHTVMYHSLSDQVYWFNFGEQYDNI